MSFKLIQNNTPSAKKASKPKRLFQSVLSPGSKTPKRCKPDGSPQNQRIKSTLCIPPLENVSPTTPKASILSHINNIIATTTAQMKLITARKNEIIELRTQCEQANEIAIDNGVLWDYHVASNRQDIADLSTRINNIFSEQLPMVNKRLDDITALLTKLTPNQATKQDDDEKLLALPLSTDTSPNVGLKKLKQKKKLNRRLAF